MRGRVGLRWKIDRQNRPDSYPSTVPRTQRPDVTTKYSGLSSGIRSLRSRYCKRAIHRLLNSSYFKRSFQLLSIRRRNVNSNDPIARHGELNRALVLSWRYFLRLGQYRSHAGMRHGSFQLRTSTGYRFSGRILNLEINCRRAHMSRLRGYVGFDGEVCSRVGRSTATSENKYRRQKSKKVVAS